MEELNDADAEARFAAIEARLDALENNRFPESAGPAHPTDELPWLLSELREHEQFPGGSVIFGGDVKIGDRRAAYQWQRPTHELTEEQWDENLERLDAIAHPVRGTLLRRLLSGSATVAELVDEGIVTSTGTAYHHLNALAAGGWTGKDSGGRHSVRVARVVPLLTIIAAAEDH